MWQPKIFTGNTPLTVLVLIKLFKDLQKAVRDEFAAGTPAFEIFTKVKLTQYDNRFPLNVQAMVVNEVLEPLSWRSGRQPQQFSGGWLHPPTTLSHLWHAQTETRWRIMQYLCLNSYLQLSLLAHTRFLIVNWPLTVLAEFYNEHLVKEMIIVPRIHERVCLQWMSRGFSCLSCGVDNFKICGQFLNLITLHSATCS